MKTHHVPGPWTAAKATDVLGNPSWRIDSAEVSLIAVLTYMTVAERDEAEATAQLIAAAPALLENLNALLANLEQAVEAEEPGWDGDPPYWLRSAKVLIEQLRRS